MAQISENFNVGYMFPQFYGEYNIEFTEEEQALLDKYTLDREFINSHEGNPGIDENSSPPGFEVNFTNYNPLYKNPEFASLKKTIDEINRHFVCNIMKCKIPDDCDLWITDSWFIKMQGGIWREKFIKSHQHGFSFISGVLYLQDSNNGFFFDNKNNTRSAVFAFDQFETDEPHLATRHEIYPQKGKIILFLSEYFHGLILDENKNDVRDSLVWNVWPMGNLCDLNASKVNTNEYRGQYGYEE